MDPYFSVILPVYNVEKYLERCVESVLCQDYTNYEIILIDDGATDSCPQICDYYANKYPFVQTVHKRNGGLSSARNVGLEIAKGKYILFCDSDDWIDKDTLSTLYKSLKREKFDLIKFNYFRHTENSIPQYSIAKAGIYKNRDDLELLRDMALYHTGKYSLSACQHGYSREFILNERIKFVSEREVGSEDYLFNIEVLMKAKSVCIIEQCLYYYDLREGSLTQRYRNSLPEQYTRLYKKLHKYLCDNNLLNQYQSRLNYFYIWNLMYSCCLVNEYNITENHSISEGRKKIKEYLSFPEVKYAIRFSEKSMLSFKQRIQLYAMRFGFEPLFYYLFVVKPQRSR